jgi:glycerol-3-phosphate dehydrogenase
MNNLSSQHRGSIIHNLKTGVYDLLVIGGGITGAGIALDAASRGLKTALVEKNDFSFGTSSRSTKLIHGGLRYLKQLEFGLVKEVGSERAVVHRLAPHLVVPEKMLLPLYEKRGFGSLLTSFGLKLYDWLAGVKREDQRKMLTKSQTHGYEPLLRKDEVKGGAIYAEYRTDDARLTIEIIKTAARHGAEVINYCKVTDFIYEAKKITGVKASDESDAGEFTIKAKVVVSATGPWVDELREVDRSKTGKYLHLTKGIHLVVAFEKLPVKQAIYFDVEDGRMIFAIPRGRTTYIGTTDTNYSGNIDKVDASRDDADYLIRAVNQTFPEVKLAVSDIESSWAGLRPLIHEEGKSASELSRKDEIFESPSGLISIAGGKLTGYRKMAERVVDLVISKTFEGLNLKNCFTDKISLVPSGFENYGEVKSYRSFISERVQALGLNGTYANYLIGNYGKQTDLILNDMKGGDPERELALAELRFTFQHEMAMKPLDFIVRRTGILYFYKNRIPHIKEAVLNEFQRRFGWSAERMQLEIETVETAIREVTNFK